jgi:hypothetical protein
MISHNDLTECPHYNVTDEMAVRYAVPLKNPAINRPAIRTELLTFAATIPGQRT